MKHITQPKKKTIMHVFKRLIIVLFCFSVLCYIYFALIPSWSGFSFPTGGWDWLSFLGGIASIIIACWGVAVTIKNSQAVSNEESIKAVRPFLNISVINFCNPTIPGTIQGIYLPYSIADETMILEDNFSYLSNMIRNYNDPSQCMLQIRNIGLGTALNIRVRIYKILRVGGKPPECYNAENVESFYKNVEINPNATILSYDSNNANICHSIDTNVYFELQPFHLNNTTDIFSIVMGQRSFSGNPAYYLLKITYDDTYNTRYLQYHHLYLNNGICKFYSTSQQFTYAEDIIKEAE